MREKDDLHKGKDDWMTYQKRRTQSEEDRLADQAKNDKIAADRLAKKEAEEADKKNPKKRNIREGNPNGGFQLG